MPESASGAFTRGGAIFIALLFNSFQAFNELPTQMMGRGITWRHKQFAFHRPSATTLAQTIADAPNNAFQILLFCIIIYFMGGFVYTAGAFFSFYLIVLSTYFSLAAFFRLLGTLVSNPIFDIIRGFDLTFQFRLQCGNYDQASRLASVIITIMITCESLSVASLI
jgi:ABC-type multidrug transport system permease subunit